MYKPILSISLVILCSLSSIAQSVNSISGKFLEENGDPAAFTTVVLLDTDSTLVKVESTDEQGAFTMSEIKAGKYRLMTRSLQYNNYLSDYFKLESGQSKKFDPITLVNSVNELEDVEVRATRPLVDIQPDKTVFNIENSLNATGADAMELLRKAPGVVIDNNDNIILQGKNGIKVYIDGKPSYLSGEELVSMLRGMTADQIESIEIITNPSAKYDAEGNAGIINIVLKRNKNLGFNGKVSANARIGEKKQYSGNFNYNYRSQKMNIYGNYGYHNNEGSGYSNFYKQLNGFTLDQHGEWDWYHNGHDLRTGLDYLINDKQTIGVVLQGNISDNGNKNYSRTPIANPDNQIENILIAENERDGTTDNVKVNLNYQIKNDDGTSVNFDADYGYFWRSRDGFLPNRYYDPQENEILEERIFSDAQDTRIDIKTLKGDYESKLAGGNLTSGLKYSNVGTKNSYDYFIHNNDQVSRDIDRSSDFDYTEIIYAAYSTYSGKIGDKLTYNAGLRVERTESEGILDSEKSSANENVTRSYTDFFPSGGIAYNISKSNNLSFNYSRRIDRPNYQDLNPFEFKLDELTFRRGNPFLKPQYTNNFQLNHSFKHKLNTSITYSITNDFFAQITDTVGQKSSMISQQNIADAQNIGLNTSYNTDITKWWNVFTNFNLFHVRYDTDYKNVNIKLNATTYNIYLQNSFNLPADIKMELSGWYNSPSIWGGTFETGDMWSVDLGLKRSVWNERMFITMGVQDIFKTQKWDGISEYGGLRIEGDGGYDSRRFTVKVDFKFGNQNVKKIRDNRKTGLEEESERIGGGGNGQQP